jgi:CheY-like chemotaxis protein
MGLSMVYGMASRHDARIEIESTPDVGTTFSILFPLGHNVSDDTDEIVADATIPKGLSILVIDDDAMVGVALKHILENDQHRVVLAEGGQEGIDLFEAALAQPAPFDVVMTDLGMPHVDGHQVAAAVKLASPTTPLIMVTGWGHSLEDEGHEGLHNVDRMIAKPPQLQALRAALAACLVK